LNSPVSSSLAASARAEELRAVAVRASRGEIVILTEDHVCADPDWLEQMVRAHEQKHAAVGGAIENGEDRWINWATYFADLGRYHNPVAPESGFASVVNVSYKRAALDRVAAVWRTRFNETEVHAALTAAGESIALSPQAIVRQHREVRLGNSLGEFFEWGRCYGRARASLVGAGRRFACLAASPLIPGLLLLRSGVDVWRKRRLFEKWIQCLPLSIALNTAWAFGEAAGYLRPRADRS
jgi:GT2 family glycosyltransferase